MGFLDGEDEGDGGDGGDGGGFEELICSEEPREIYSNVRQVSMGPQSKLTKNCTHRSTQSNRKRKENRNCRVSARSRESEVASNDDIDRLMPGVSPYMTFAQPRNLFWLWKKNFTYPQRSADTAHSSRHIMSYSNWREKAGINRQACR